MPSVFITAKIPKSGIDLLIRKGYKVHVNNSGKDLTKDELKRVFTTYNAVLTLMTDKIDEDIIVSASPNLRVIANFAVGYDNIDVIGAKRQGIVVCNTPGVAGEAVAEHTFMLILSTAKRLIESDRYVRQKKYQTWEPLAFLSPQIWGKTLGIVGLGKIGTYVGHIAYGGFKMNILYCDLVRSEDFEMLTEAQFVDLSKLLSEADVVTLHVPLTPQTKHLIGRKQLETMKKSAILINTSRGPVIDEEALIWALTEHQIAGAGLDVFEHEPHIPNELSILANVVLTPHSASATFECREATAKIAAENIISVFEGKTPFGLVKLS